MPNPGPASTVSPHYLLQADSSDGYQIGSLSTTPIGMYGAAGVPQRSNAAQLTVSSNASAGTLLSLQTLALSPAGVGINTTLSMAITLTQSPVVTTDFIGIINKPTSQAGLGIANVRPHGATNGLIVIQYFNNTGSTITPSATEIYSVVNFRGLASSVTLSPTGIAANSASEQTFNVTGIAPGELIMLSKPSEQVGLGIAGMRAAGNNLLGITFMNNSSAAITPTASESYSYLATGGMAANSNLLIYGVNVGTTLTPPVTTTTQSWAVTEQSLTVTTILANDTFIAASKPSLQGNYSIVGGRITSVNTVILQLGSGTVTGVTPTASEVYAVTLYRQAPLAPFTVLTATIAPTAIGGNNTAEQGFTLTPLPVQSAVWVNKPTATANIGIVGCRVSAVGVVGITFANATVGTTITPPAEVYTFGIVQPSPSGGSNVQMQVAQGLVGTNLQANELRLAMANIGMITGGTP